MKVLGRTTRILLAGLVIGVFLAILGGALTIPFFYESPSLLYRFGIERALLRAGKMAGLAAAVLLLFQLVTAAGVKPLDRLFSLPGLYRIHRISAWAIALLVLLHPILVFAPDGMVVIPLESRYWPEWAGVALLLLIIAQVVIGKWRRFFFKRYQRWRTAHRIAGAAAIALMMTHVLSVSETFQQGSLPRTLVLCAAGIMASFWLWVRVRGLLTRVPFTVARIETAGKDAATLTLEQAARSQLTFLPGQFAFLSVRNKRLSREPHPFSIASSPLRLQRLQFTIRACGDWTSRISRLQVGDRVHLRGPYGRFSHLHVPAGGDVVMIAGGIGITPMLSMLRFMRDAGEQRRVLLLWSNRTHAHVFAEEELAGLGRELTGFKWVPVFTRTQSRESRGAAAGRIDRTKLEDLLRDHGRNADVFLCGPPAMMRQIRKDLRAIGFPAKKIHTESFGF